MSMIQASHYVRSTIAGCTATAMVATFLLAAPANAFGTDASEGQATKSAVAEAFAGVEAVNPDLIREPLSPELTVGTFPLGHGAVDVPSNLTTGVTFTAPDGGTLTISPSDVSTAEQAAPLPRGGVVFPDEDSAHSVIVVDQGVQMLTTMMSPDAPTRHSYDLDLAPGQQLQLVDDGVVVTDADGSVILSAAAPWATDAEGNAVPTTYEVDGSTLTQVVEHTTVDAAYPIVADPIWLAPWVVKCLVGIGISGPDIVRIASLGSPWSIGAAFGRAAVACVFGR